MIKLLASLGLMREASTDALQSGVEVNVRLCNCLRPSIKAKTSLDNVARQVNPCAIP